MGHFVSLGIGGADRAAYNLALGLKSLGSAPTIFYSENSIPSRTHDQDPHQPLLNILSLYQENFETQRIDKVEDFNSHGLDILHTHRSGEDHWLLPGLDRVPRSYRIVETNFHGQLKTPADFRIFPTHELMRWHRIKLSENSAVIPNAILPPLSDVSFRPDLGIGEDTVILGRLARADDSVFSPSLLKAYKTLRKERSVCLVWVGSSEQAKDAALRLGLSDVHWVDPVRDPVEVSTWMNTFDIFCHFNKLGETFGNTVAEAMMHQKPVVSLAGSFLYPQAQREVLGDERVLHRRLSGAVSELRLLISNVEHRKSVGFSNKTRAMQNFFPGRVASDTSLIYNRAINLR